MQFLTSSYFPLYNNHPLLTHINTDSSHQIMDNLPPPPSRQLQLPLRNKSPKRPRNAKNLSLNVPSFSQISSTASLNGPKTATASSFSLNSPSYPPPNMTLLQNQNIPETFIRDGRNHQSSSSLPAILDSNGSALNKKDFQSSSLAMPCSAIKLPNQASLAQLETHPTDISNKPYPNPLPMTNSNSQATQSTSLHSTAALPLFKTSKNNETDSNTIFIPSSTQNMDSSLAPSSNMTRIPQQQQQKHQPLSITIPQSPTSGISSDSTRNTGHSPQKFDHEESSNRQYPSSHSTSPKRMTINSSPSAASSSSPQFISTSPSSSASNNNENTESSESFAPNDRVVVVNTIPFGDPNDLESSSVSSYPSGPVMICHPNIYLYSEPTKEEAAQFDVVINVAREVRNPFVPEIDFEHQENHNKSKDIQDKSIHITTSTHKNNSNIIFISHQKTHNDGNSGNNNFHHKKEISDRTSTTTQPLHNFNSSPLSKNNLNVNANQNSTNPTQSIPTLAHDSLVSDALSTHSSISSISTTCSSSSSFSASLSIPSSPPSLESATETLMSSPTSNSSVLSSSPFQHSLLLNNNNNNNHNNANKYIHNEKTGNFSVNNANSVNQNNINNHNNNNIINNTAASSTNNPVGVADMWPSLLSADIVDEPTRVFSETHTETLTSNNKKNYLSQNLTGVDQCTTNNSFCDDDNKNDETHKNLLLMKKFQHQANDIQAITKKQNQQQQNQEEKEQDSCDEESAIIEDETFIDHKHLYPFSSYSQYNGVLNNPASSPSTSSLTSSSSDTLRNASLANNHHSLNSTNHVDNNSLANKEDNFIFSPFLPEDDQQRNYITSSSSSSSSAPSYSGTSSQQIIKLNEQQRKNQALFNTDNSTIDEEAFTVSPTTTTSTYATAESSTSPNHVATDHHNNKSTATASNSSTSTPEKFPEYIYVPWDHNSKLTTDLEHLTNLIAEKAQDSNKKILIHCQCGVSRSASLLVAYVMRKNPSWGVHEAYSWVKNKSPSISPNMSLIYQLMEWSQMVQKLDGSTNNNNDTSNDDEEQEERSLIGIREEEEEDEDMSSSSSNKHNKPTTTVY